MYDLRSEGPMQITSATSNYAPIIYKETQYYTDAIFIILCEEGRPAHGDRRCNSGGAGNNCLLGMIANVHFILFPCISLQCTQHFFRLAATRKCPLLTGGLLLDSVTYSGIRLSPNTGSGPVKGVWEACLARKLAFSLPIIPQCPGAHFSWTLLKLLKYWSASVTVSYTHLTLPTIYSV